MDLQFAGSPLDDVHRRQRAFLHVIVEGFRAELLVRVDPRNHEHRDALIDAPFDEGFFRLEVEDVEFVDPRRHDQQRRAQHVFRRGRVLDQLHQLVLEDHLARGGRHVDADRQIGGVGLADPQRAVARLDVFREHLHAAHQIVAARRQCLAQDFRIGEDEVRRRERVGDLLDVEFGLLAGVRIDAFGVAHQLLRPLRREQIELHHEIEELIRFPFGVAEPLVARRWRNRRRRLLAGEPAHRGAPQIEIGLGHLHLQIGRPVIVRQPIFRHRAEGLDHLGELAGGLVPELAVLARLEVGRERLAAAFHRPRKVHREGFRVELLRGRDFGGDVTHDRTL
jgi:hypothetical protein